MGLGDGIFDIEYSGTNRSPCPVCGNLTGDCKGEDTPGLVHMVELKKPKKRDPMATFIVPRRVFTEETVGTRVVRKLLYAVGDRVRPEEARRVGLLP